MILKVLIRRVIFALVTIWMGATLAFFALRILPGDAVENQLTRLGLSEAVIAQQRSRLGLDRPLPLQYAAFIAGLLVGDLGVSLYSGEPVVVIIMRGAASTVILSTAAMIAAVLLGIALGLGSAAQFRFGIGRVFRLITVLALSIPIYWTGTLVIYWIAGQVGGSKNILLPIAVLGFHSAGPIARITHTSIEQIRNAAWIKTAAGKGLSDQAILRWHILRVGLIPVVTMSALQAAFLLSGTVITESIFQQPGIGALLLNAVIDRDFPLVQGIIVLIVTIYLLCTTIADLITRFLDPRMAAV